MVAIVVESRDLWGRKGFFWLLIIWIQVIRVLRAIRTIVKKKVGRGFRMQEYTRSEN